MSTRVAVIGAGAAGLCAVRHLASRPSFFSVTAFEQGERVGGTWVYTERTDMDLHGLPIHSSMYRNLKTNLPKEVMAFPDFPFDKNLPSFVTHSDVLAYLEQYASHFSLLQHIKFQTQVVKVDPISCGENGLKTGLGERWEVTTASVTDKDSCVTEQFDAVIVCNGNHCPVQCDLLVMAEDLVQKYVETQTLSDEDAWEADARAKRPGMSRAEATDYYNQVAKELYEEYLNRQRYGGPVIAAEAVADFFPENCRDNKLVLDFAAGTGFVGEELRRLGFKKLHCLEPSRGMLDVARQKKIYMREYCCYLDHNPLPMDDNVYDCAVCSGGFGKQPFPQPVCNSWCG